MNLATNYDDVEPHQEILCEYCHDQAPARCYRESEVWCEDCWDYHPAYVCPLCGGLYNEVTGDVDDLLDHQKRKGVRG